MQLVEITGLSQVWSDSPEWYIWLKNKPGPYNLILSQATEQSIGDKFGLIGYFTIRCFPKNDSVFFQYFSKEEQDLLDSPLFDQNNTPVYNSKSQIPSNFFNIGTLIVFTDKNNCTTVLNFESFDSFKVTEESSTQIDINNQDTRKGNKILRCVPGWEIGYPIFDTIASLYAYQEKLPPSWFRLTKSPGIEFMQKTNEIEKTISSASNAVFSACLLFSHFKNIQHKDYLPELEPKEEIVIDQFFDSSPLSPTKSDNIYFNKLWWDISNKVFSSDLMCTCGCQGTK